MLRLVWRYPEQRRRLDLWDLTGCICCLNRVTTNIFNPKNVFTQILFLESKTKVTPCNKNSPWTHLAQDRYINASFEGS